MPTDLINITGKMNLDAANAMMPKGDYGEAFNIVRDAQGAGKDFVVSNMLGNTQAKYVFPEGVNKNIGKFSDNTRDRIYMFTWNSLGFHSIIYYNNPTSTFVKLIINKTDSGDVDILGFNPSYRINHVDVLYREEDEGDLLFWTDGLNPPSELNALTAQNGLYLPYIRSYLDVAREPSFAPPYCVYENDPTVTVNNLRKKLFRFKIRWWFDNLEKSTTSCFSEIPVPVNYIDQTIDSDPTKNCAIFMVVQTGEKNVVKIEILAQQQLVNSWSDFFSIAVLDKELLNIPNNNSVIYHFYNDKAYNYIDLQESIELFDYVPLKAFNQALLNGNVLDYGNITENYDLLLSDIRTSDSANTSVLQLPIMELLYAQDIYISGVKYTKIIVGGVNTLSVGDTLIINTDNPASIEYTVIDGDTDTTVLNGIAASAISFGYSVLSNVGNELTIRKVGTNLLTYYIEPSVKYKSLLTPQISFTASGSTLIIDSFSDNSYFPQGQTFTIDNSLLNTGTLTVDRSEVFYVSGVPNVRIYLEENVIDESLTTGEFSFINPNNILPNSIAAYDWKSRYEFGVVYFDEKGRTNSVITNIEAIIQTDGYTESAGMDLNFRVPNIPLYIYNRPPLWAKWYSLVRTKDLSKSYILQWVSVQTFKDAAVNNNGYQYAYISIANLNQFITDNPSSKFLAYGFTPNDRIRFIKRFNGGIANVYDNFDYEIIDSLTDPIINGVVQLGQILKIVLPVTYPDGFDFGTELFNNYQIEIYTPAQSVANDLDLYYEFGQQKLIGNWGTNQAFHYGELQNQSIDLVTPATFITNRGDYWYRQRKINAGNEVKFVAKVGSISGSGVIGFTSVETFKSYNYVAKDNVYGSLISDDNWNLSVTNSSTFYFILNGSLTVTPADDGDIVLYAFLTGPSIGSPSVEIGRVNGAIGGVTYTIPINTQNRIVPSYLELRFSFSSFTGNIIGGTIYLTDAEKQFNVGCIDPNFSDSFESKVNSNGRAFVIDPNAKQTTNPVLTRNGQAYQQGTNINQINRFYGINFDQYDRGNGAITKMFFEGRSLYVFQEFDIGVVPVLQQIVLDTAGNPLQANSDTLLNKIQYPYKGKYGMTFASSFAYYKNAKYGVDGNKKVAWRLSTDGITELSIIYGCNAFFQDALPAYNFNLNNGYAPTGEVYIGNPTVLGGFDFFTNKYIVGLEEIKRYNSEGTLIFKQDPSTLVFWETRNQFEGFECKTNYYPENIGCLGSLLFTFKEGQLWFHNNDTKYCNFYGVQYYPSISLIFNKDVALRKTYNDISFQTNNFWEADINGMIETSEANEFTRLPQISQLKLVDFEQRGDYRDAAFLRDANSMPDAREALINGDFLEGVWIKVNLRYKGSAFSYLYLPYILWSLNNRNF